MGKSIDLTGQRFGRLMVVSETSIKKYGKRVWLCSCDCGNEKLIVGGDFVSGRTSSCGCFRMERLKQRITSHGRAKHSIYTIWAGMVKRCNNKKMLQYKDYGGRGIKVCSRWNKFKNFLADMGERPEGMSLDRIDNDGNYEPLNCRWATNIEQANNTRKNVLITYKDKTLTLAEWSRKLSINYGTLKHRLRSGWSTKDILCKPVRKVNGINR